MDSKACADLSWLLVLKSVLAQKYWLIDVWSQCKKCDGGEERWGSDDTYVSMRLIYSISQKKIIKGLNPKKSPRILEYNKIL